MHTGRGGEGSRAERVTKHVWTTKGLSHMQILAPTGYRVTHLVSYNLLLT